MSYRSYTGPRWTVTHAGPDSKCQPGDRITFEGPSDKVVIHCNESTPYLDGRYHLVRNIIERANDYEIQMNPPGTTIFFTQKGSSDSTGGSWTAEDYIPGPGEG